LTPPHAPEQESKKETIMHRTSKRLFTHILLPVLVVAALGVLGALAGTTGQRGGPPVADAQTPYDQIGEPARFPNPFRCYGHPATIVGTAGNDILRGTAGPDVIVGLGGDDIIYGGDGDDYLCGDEGSDQLYGGGDSDYLNGGSGPFNTLFLFFGLDLGWDRCDAIYIFSGDYPVECEVYGPEPSPPPR
jgi:hypothetical protein